MCTPVNNQVSFWGREGGREGEQILNIRSSSPLKFPIRKLFLWYLNGIFFGRFGLGTISPSLLIFLLITTKVEQLPGFHSAKVEQLL